LEDILLCAMQGKVVENKNRITTHLFILAFTLNIIIILFVAVFQLTEIIKKLLTSTFIVRK
jgi:hypothetical protein